MFTTLIVNVTDTKFIPGKVLSTNIDHPELQPLFAEYLAYRLKNDLVRYIKTQRYAKKGKWVPLKYEYVQYKKRKGLSTNTWEATSRLVESLTVTKRGSTIYVGISKSKMYPESQVKVIQVARWLEYGTDRIPPRPLFRPIIRIYRKNVKRYWKDFMDECFTKDGELIKSNLKPRSDY